VAVLLLFRVSIPYRCLILLKKILTIANVAVLLSWRSIESKGNYPRNTNTPCSTQNRNRDFVRQFLVVIKTEVLFYV